ncbi:MAG: oligopeptide/dipeptide ABC transporter ATP-binding protein, partial [Pseudomonadales bacterium]
ALARAPRPTMSGEIPSPVNLGAGCRFASRCPEATERCRQETPLLKPVEAGNGGGPRLVACHLYP